MDIARPEFRPDPSLSTAEMESLQREISDVATFTDDHGIDPEQVALDGPAGQSTLAETGPTGEGASREKRPLVAGVDQAFAGDDAVSAIVVLRGRAIVERVSAVEPAEIPYVPGLLSFREGGAILSAFENLECEP